MKTFNNNAPTLTTGLTGLLLLTHSPLAWAQSTVWQALGEADWFTAGNWTSGVPTATNSTGIENGGTAEVTSAGAVAQNLILGINPATTGSLNVSGAGTFTSTDYLTVADNGTGFLNITNGGQVTAIHSSIAQSASGSGTTTVSGANSLLNLSGDLAVGSSGSGVLSVQSQGSVANDALALIGSAPGANGLATVSGLGSTWQANDYLSVGSSGTGILNITSGGEVSVGSIADLGSYSGSNGTLNIDGNGSKFIQAGGADLSLAIGYEGTGTATVSNGGLLDHSSITDDDLLIALEAGSTGTLNIGAAAGASSTGAGLVSATGIFGGNGTATVNFNHNEADYVLTDNGTSTGNAVPLSGSLSVNHDGSGTTTLLGTHTYSGATNVNGGALYVNGSIESSITVGSGATLGGSGSVGALVLVESGGTLAPGNSPGTLNVQSLALEPTATIALELAGTSGSLFDQIDVLDGAALDGILDISYFDAFTASEGQSFTILSADSLTGTFTTVNFPDSQDWVVGYDYVNGTVQVGIVPEPSALALLALAIPASLLRRRTRSHS